MEESTKTQSRKSIPKPKKGISGKIWRGNEQHEHSLFKLLPANSLSNVSFQAFRPIIKEKFHAHFYHSVDKKGRNNVHCAPMAGHFHEVTPEWDGDSLINVKCGPPLRFKWRQSRSGEMRKQKERVIYRGEDREGSRDIKDDHIHEIQYIRSEIIKLNSKQETNTQHLFAGQNKHDPEILKMAAQNLKEKS